MEFKDYYAVMGVAKDATEDEVKRAYRKLARKFHPDVSKEPDAESKFKEVGEAYEVLKDPEKRAAYDQLGRDWKAGQEFRPPPNWDEGFEFSDTADDVSASEFFEALFGNREAHGFHSAHTGRQPRSQDHHARVVIDLEDAFHGATRTITLHSPEIDAQGHVKARERTLRVKIPKGIKRGQQIRLAGQGNGTGAGDLYLEVEFKSHPIYRVEGNDLHLNLPVAPWEAALGAKVKVPTPAGVIDLTIPSGSKAGSQLRLKGRGIPGDSAGDMYAHLQLVLPPVDSEQAKALYRQMEQQLAFNPRAALGV